MLVAFLLPVVAAGAVALDVGGPCFRGALVLTPVLEDLCQLIHSLLADPVVRARGEGLVAGDEMMLGRQLEALDARGQPGQRFAVAQRGQRKPVVTVAGGLVIGAAQIV